MIIRWFTYYSIVRILIVCKSFDSHMSIILLHSYDVSTYDHCTIDIWNLYNGQLTGFNTKPHFHKYFQMHSTSYLSWKPHCSASGSSTPMYTSDGKSFFPRASSYGCSGTQIINSLLYNSNPTSIVNSIPSQSKCTKKFHLLIFVWPFFGFVLDNSLCFSGEVTGLSLSSTGVGSGPSLGNCWTWWNFGSKQCFLT